MADKFTARCSDGNNVVEGCRTSDEVEYDATESADMTDEVVVWAVEPVVCQGG